MPADHTRYNPAFRLDVPAFGQPAAIRRNENGSLIAELALIGPIFLLLLFVIGETTLVFMTERAMDRSIATTVDELRNSAIRPAELDAMSFRDRVCQRAGFLVDCDDGDFAVDVRSYSDFTAAGRPPVGDVMAAPRFDFGGPGDIVVVRASYLWRTNPISSRLAAGNLINGKRQISAFAAYRNDPAASAGMASVR